MHIFLLIKLLLLMSIANGAPVLIKKVYGNWFPLLIDGGCKFLDGRPVFGRSKTIRGVLVSVMAAGAAAPCSAIQ